MDMPKRDLYHIAAKEAHNELTDNLIYTKLSEIEKERSLVTLFSNLAKMEDGHYRFWKQYCSGAVIYPNNAKIYFILLIRRLLGPSFVIKYLEGGEKDAIKRYGRLRGVIPQSGKKAFESMIRDEAGHEQAFADKIRGSHVRYMSFIVLGLADALVEIAGIHAGSLGIYSSTELTGLAGIVAGAAASISMASAAFAQAKQGFEGSAKVAAAYTGLSYFFSAVMMALPYFLTKDSVLAISISLVLGMVLIGFVSWYNSVISDRNMRRDFLEVAGVMLGATVALFFIGLIIRFVFGITI